MRIPKTVKRFEESFSISDMQPPEWMAAIEAALVRQREAAAQEAGRWLFDRGYFNGEITNDVTDESGGTTKVTATLLCWGLPHINPTGTCEDCGGLGSPSGEMAGMVCGSCNGTGIESDVEID